MDAVGSMYVSDVKQHSEASNFPNADVTRPLGNFPRLKAGGWGVCRATRQTRQTCCRCSEILYAARIARFDLLRTVNRLARRITKWTEEDDAAQFRLISFIQHSKEDKMIGWVGDDMSSLRLALYVDADFAGCVESLRSTSGAHLNLQGPHTRFPLAGLSKRQGCVSHSKLRSCLLTRRFGPQVCQLWTCGISYLLLRALFVCVRIIKL